MNDIETLKRFLRLLESSIKLRGSPRGYGASHPYAEKEVNPVYGQSNYPLDDHPEEEPKSKKVKVSKHLTKQDGGLDDE